LDRRDFIAGSTALAAGSLFPQLAGAAPAIKTSLLPSQKAVFADVQKMNALGPRFCGNAAHETYTQWLEDQMKKVGLTVDYIPHTALVFWEPKTVSLKTAGGQAIPVGAFNRWSPVTGEEGITGPIGYVGRVEGASRFSVSVQPELRPKLTVPADLKGKIALIEIVARKRPLHLLYPEKDVNYWFDKDRNEAFPAEQGPSASNQSLLPKDAIDEIKKAGAVGIIYAWVGLADDDAQGQTRTGTGSQTYDADKGLPSLWVVPSTGAELRKMAETGEAVTLTVTATIVPNKPTHTLIGTLPGMSDETIILWTHTDGQNAVEENGGPAIIAMLSYLSKLPKSQRQRTIKVVMPEGHFAEQYLPAHAWIKERPELCEKAVALVSVEHLGCMEWLSDPVTNTYKPTGKAEFAYAFCPTKPLQDAGAEAMRAQSSGREVIIGNAARTVTPGTMVWFAGHVPCFCFIITPSYLVSDNDNGHIGKLSPKVYHEQLKMFMQLTRDLDATPKSVLKP
jgi:hypothetical protein